MLGFGFAGRDFGVLSGAVLPVELSTRLQEEVLITNQTGAPRERSIEN
jgi:hypothetical protein